MKPPPHKKNSPKSPSKPTVEGNLPLVWSIARACLARCEGAQSSATLDEMFSDGLCALRDVCEQYKPSRGRFSTFAYTRIRACINRGQRQRRCQEARRALEDIDPRRLADAAPGPAQAVIAAEIRQLLTAGLSAEDHLLFTLCFFDNCSSAQAARRVGICRNTVAGRLRAICQRLRADPALRALACDKPAAPPSTAAAAADLDGLPLPSLHAIRLQVHGRKPIHRKTWPERLQGRARRAGQQGCRRREAERTTGGQAAARPALEGQVTVLTGKGARMNVRPAALAPSSFAQPAISARKDRVRAIA